jgi:hypothetical protein
VKTKRKYRNTPKAGDMGLIRLLQAPSCPSAIGHEATCGPISIRRSTGLSPASRKRKAIALDPNLAPCQVLLRPYALAQWFRARTETARGTRKTMIVALARKLLIALWRLVREGVAPDGVVMNGGR